MTRPVRTAAERAAEVVAAAWGRNVASSIVAEPRADHTEKLVAAAIASAEAAVWEEAAEVAIGDAAAVRKAGSDFAFVAKLFEATAKLFRSRAVLPWHDCPRCPECKCTVGIPRSSHPRGAEMNAAHRLACPACGASWLGSDEDVAQATKAQLAWDLAAREGK